MIDLCLHTKLPNSSMGSMLASSTVTASDYATAYVFAAAVVVVAAVVGVLYFVHFQDLSFFHFL